MKFYFDESGSFKVPDDAGAHAVGIVSGVVIPDSQEAEDFAQFDAFVAKLPPRAFKNGEPKGRLLDEQGRTDLVDMLIGLPRGILLCPTMLDLTSLIGKSEANMSSLVSAKLTHLQATCKHATFRQQVGDLAAKVSGMSNQQVLRLASWAKCINRCINDSIIVHCVRDFHDDWSTMRFEIDPVQQNGGTEADVFDFLLRSWLVAWSQETPFATIEGIHTPDHPFMKEWHTPGGIDAAKIVNNNIHYVPSHQSKGIQLADMTATLVRRAVIGLATPRNLENYGFMMTKTIGRPLHASGLFFFTPHDRDETERRYQGLADAMNIARKLTPGTYALP